MDYSWWLYFLIAVVAFLYASVGHGGASGYLALMAIMGMAPDVMRPTALVLNLFVSGIAFWQFYIAKHFRWSLLWPFLVFSIPFSFIGGTIHVDVSWYKKILGVLLFFPIGRFLFIRSDDKGIEKSPLLIWALLIGGIIGLLSGLIGIGGGILLAPILLLFHWADQKKAAAVCSLFIFINSLAGLLGQIQKGITWNNSMTWFIFTAIVGGTAGAYLGAKKLDQSIIKYILILVLTLAAIKLIFAV